MSSKHGPNSWEDYLNVHRSRIDDFLGHFILEDRLTFTRTPRQVSWDGEILCQGGIEIHVRKRQEVDVRRGVPWVRTTDYSYQVVRRERGVVMQLFRYDNAPHHGHPDPHHRHEFDANGREIHPPVHVGVAGWPTLGDVIEEANARWQGTDLSPP